MIKSLELKKQLDEKRAALTDAETRCAGFVERENEIVKKIETATNETRSTIDAEIETFKAERATAEAECANLRELITNIENEIAEIEKNEPSKAEKKIERKLEKMENVEIRNTKEYINAYANYIKTGEADEVRSLLTENAVADGQIPVPAFVEGLVRTAWDNETIVKDIRKTYLKGNVKIGFEISADGAVVHHEGGADIDEEEIALGIVTMVPENVKKWITVSDESIDLNGEAFLRYIYEEITSKIAKKIADMIVALVVNSPAASTSTYPGQPAITTAISQSTVAEALGLLADGASKPCVIMNKGTWSLFKAAQYDGNFSADIFEGLEVKFNDSLPVYTSASAGDVYAIVGDLAFGAQMNLPNGEEVKFVYDDLSLAEKDLVKIVGREYVGMGLVAPRAFCKIKKPSA